MDDVRDDGPGLAGTSPVRRDELEAALGLGRRPRRSRWLLPLLALAVAAGGLAWWLVAVERPAASPYLTEPVTRGPLQVTVVATGTVEPTNLVEVSSELSGTLREVLVDQNDLVAAGQPLARLDTSKLEAQLAHSRATLEVRQARVAEAEATLQEARDQNERVASLAERSIATIQARDNAVANLRRAQSVLAVVRADVDVARADLLLDETNLAKAVIKSPISGVILERHADAGQIVASSLQAPVLFTIAQDLRQMELRADVDEADMGQVAVGQPASFTVEAYPARSFPATIAELRYAPKTVEGVVTYEAILSIDNAELLLRPGMTATAEITVARIEDALLVPNAALRFVPPATVETRRTGGAGLIGLIFTRPPPGTGPPSAAAEVDPQGWRTVWVLREDGAGAAAAAAVPQRVRIGASDGTRTELLEPGGVAPGDRVITDLAAPPS